MVGLVLFFSNQWHRKEINFQLLSKTINLEILLSPTRKSPLRRSGPLYTQRLKSLERKLAVLLFRRKQSIQQHIQPNYSLQQNSLTTNSSDILQMQRRNTQNIIPQSLHSQNIDSRSMRKIQNYPYSQSNTPVPQINKFTHSSQNIDKRNFMAQQRPPSAALSINGMISQNPNTSQTPLLPVNLSQSQTRNRLFSHGPIQLSSVNLKDQRKQQQHYQMPQQSQIRPQQQQYPQQQQQQQRTQNSQQPQQNQRQSIPYQPKIISNQVPQRFNMPGQIPQNMEISTRAELNKTESIDQNSVIKTIEVDIHSSKEPTNHSRINAPIPIQIASSPVSSAKKQLGMGIPKPTQVISQSNSPSIYKQSNSPTINHKSSKSLINSGIQKFQISNMNSPNNNPINLSNSMQPCMQKNREREDTFPLHNSHFRMPNNITEMNVIIPPKNDLTQSNLEGYPASARMIRTQYPPKKQEDPHHQVQMQGLSNQFQITHPTRNTAPLSSRRPPSKKNGQTLVPRSKHFFYLEQISKGVYSLPDNPDFEKFVQDCKAQYIEAVAVFKAELNFPYTRTPIELPPAKSGSPFSHPGRKTIFLDLDETLLHSEDMQEGKKYTKTFSFPSKKNPKKIIVASALILERRSQCQALLRPVPQKTQHGL